jgi:4-amino-4-deoxy-L-arabinose transferase-like glycosyltransferase
MWVVWGALTYVTLAFADGIVHNYYVCVLAPALAALAGIGVQLAREAGRWGWAVAVAALAATAGVQVVLVGRVDGWQVLRWAVPIGVAVSGVVVFAALVRGTSGRRVALGALAAGSVVVAVAPAVWAAAGVRQPGSGLFPEARPSSGGAGAGAMFDMFDNQQGLPEDMAHWLRSQLDGERWMVAVGSAMEAQANIIGGDSVVALGGFMGTDPANSVERVAEAVDDGDLRFVLTGGGFPGAGGSSAAVAAACEEVDRAAWSPSPEEPAEPADAGPSGAGGPFGPGAGTLYDCAGRGEALRANADAAPEGGTGGFPGAGGPGGGQPPGGDLLEFGRCVVDNGGDPLELATGNSPSDATRRALDACQDVMPSGGPPGFP